MSTPLLKFARSFEQLKLRLRLQPAGDVRLLQLAGYWPNLQQYMGKSGYQSYFEEYVALLLDHINAKNLADLLPDELRQLLEVLYSLRQIGADPDFVGIDDDITRLVGIETTRKLFFAGAVGEGIDCLTRTLNIESVAVEIPESDEQPPEIDLLKMVHRKLAASNSRLADPVGKMLREWEIAHEALSYEEANCLFVERSEEDDLVRGRLRSLLGSAEYCQKAAKSDEVTFENQIKAPDDPFVGAVYDALQAVSRILGRSGIGSRTEDHIRARFAISDSEHAFTGDSVGLAAALVTYTQLLQPEVLKHERFIACESAFTGGVDSSGSLQPVNNDTLKAKIKRVFFSPVRYLVLPEANMESAREAVAELELEYPRRRLLLIGEETLAHIIENRNIIRAEKVCTGRYVMRKAHTYGRLVKVQVPLLLILLYVLVCLVYPKAWFGFDRNPDIVKLNESRDKVLVFNRNSDFLWGRNCDCSPVIRLYAEACDIDSDNRNEVVYMHQIDEDVPCTTSAMLSAYDDNGELLFTRMGSIVGEYPGDTIRTQNYRAKHLFVLESTRGPVIVTNCTQNNPARSHLKIWSAEGDLLGWYVHSGHIYNAVTADVNEDGDREILGIGINNRMGGGSGFFILPGKGAYGVSPPYEDAGIDLGNVKRGNQLHYILIPISDLAQADSVPYGGGALIAVLPGGQLRIDILTHSNLDRGVWRSFYLDSKMRVYKVSPSDNFWARRQKFVEGGYLPAMDVDSFGRWELGRVRYWSDTGWVSQMPQDNSQ